jgi:hypothetical protein
MEMTWIEKLLCAAIAVIMLLAGIGVYTNGDRFKKVCDDARGTTVWDGRQYQCIKP